MAATWDFEGEDISDFDIDLQLGTLYALANDTASNGAPTLYYKVDSSEDPTEAFTALSTEVLPERANSRNGSRQSLVSFGRLYYHDYDGD